MSWVELQEAEQASNRLVAALRKMSSGIRENLQSVENATAPGQLVARQHRAEMILRETTTEINSAKDTINATCNRLDEQESLKKTIQRLRKCQAADESRMQQVLNHIADLGVDIQTLPTASSWRQQVDSSSEREGSEDCSPSNTGPNVPLQLQQCQAAFSNSKLLTTAATFSVQESPAMGLLRPGSSHISGPQNEPVHFKPLDGSCAHSCTSDHLNISAHGHSRLRTEATFNSIGSDAGSRDVENSSAPMHTRHAAGAENSPTARFTANVSGAQLAESLSSPFVRFPGPEGADFRPAVENHPTSTFVKSSKQDQETKKTPEKDYGKVKQQNDLIADVLARHNIKLTHWNRKK